MTVAQPTTCSLSRIGNACLLGHWITQGYMLFYLAGIGLLGENGGGLFKLLFIRVHGHRHLFSGFPLPFCSATGAI